MTVIAPPQPTRLAVARVRGSRALDLAHLAALPVLVVVMVAVGVGPWLGETASGQGALVSHQADADGWLLVMSPLLVLLHGQFLPGWRRLPLILSWRLIRRAVGLGLLAGLATGALALGVWELGRWALGGHVSGPVAGLIAAVPVAAACTYAPSWLALRSDFDSSASIACSVGLIRHLGRRSLLPVALSVSVVVAQWLVWLAPAGVSGLMLGLRALVGVGVVAAAAVSTRTLAASLSEVPPVIQSGRPWARLPTTVLLLVAAVATAGLMQPRVTNDHHIVIGSDGPGSQHRVAIELRSGVGTAMTLRVLTVEPEARLRGAVAWLGRPTDDENPGVLQREQPTTAAYQVRPYGRVDLAVGWHGRACPAAIPVMLHIDVLGRQRDEFLDVHVDGRRC